MKSKQDRVRDLLGGCTSRRDFVEWAAAGGLGLASTAAALRAQSRASAASTRRRDRNQTNVSPYDEWLKAEGIPVYRDYGIADLRALELGDWKRMGARGAWIDLKGGEGVNDGYVCEMAPGGSTAPQRYLFEEILYVLAGEGETVIWNPGGPKRSVKWQAGAILAPPLNAWRQHFNRGKTPARFVASTNAPVVIEDRKSTRLNSSHIQKSRMPSSA